jgi:hypothetical protein
MKNSLISVNKLISEGLKVEFDKDGRKVNNVHGIVVVQARRAKNLYLLNINVRKESANVAKSSNERATVWHQRLGHLNMVSFKKLETMVNGMKLKEVSLHHVCDMANSMIGGVLDNNVWYVDSGASNHMTSHGEWFRDTKDLKTPRFVETSDDTTHPITQIGKVPLSMQNGQIKYLKDVLHVPTITKNLVSIGETVEQGLHVTFNPNGCFVEYMNNQGKLIAKGERNGHVHLGCEHA